MRRRRALALLLTGALALTACQGKPDALMDGGELTIGVGGQSLLVYLPTTLAAQLGYYEDEGLKVAIRDLQGGSKALQALEGGSVDVVSGYYDHTIQMQAKDRHLTSFVTMLRYPSIVLAVSPKASRPIESIADLVGANVGVTSQGSSTDYFLRYLLAKNGKPPESARVHAIGGTAGAVAAMEQGQVDAAAMLDPAFSVLQTRAGPGNVKILNDTRTARGVLDDFGVSTYPAAVLYSSSSWLTTNGDVARKLANAVVKALKWISSHTPDEIAGRMPAEYAYGNREVYIQAIARAKESYSRDGVMQEEGARAVRDVLTRFDPAVAGVPLDLDRTYSNDYLPR